MRISRLFLRLSSGRLTPATAEKSTRHRDNFPADFSDGLHLNSQQHRPVVEPCTNIEMIRAKSLLPNLNGLNIQRVRLTVLSLKHKRKKIERIVRAIDRETSRWLFRLASKYHRSRSPTGKVVLGHACPIILKGTISRVV